MKIFPLKNNLLYGRLLLVPAITYVHSCTIAINLRCIVVGLKFLVRLCTDLGLKDAQEYIQKLKKAEKAREVKQQVCIIQYKSLAYITLLLLYRGN